MITSKLAVSDFASSKIKQFSKEIDANNKSIKTLSEEKTKLEGAKITPEQSKAQDQLIEDANVGDPHIGKDIGKLVRHAFEQNKNAKIDEKTGELQGIVTALQQLNSIDQKFIEVMQLMIVGEGK